MDERLQICAEFIERHPDEAARALLGLHAAESVAVIEALPVTASARVVGRVGAMRAARWLHAMDAGIAAGLLAALPTEQAASILRLVDAGLRSEMLERQPLQSRHQLTESLDYPPDTVGAIMTTGIAVLDDGRKVADALDALRETETDDLQYAFVISRSHGIAGIIPLLTLLRSPSRTRLSELVDAPPGMILSRTSIDSAAGLEAWRTHSVLPVCNRQRHLVGALAHAALRRSLAVSRPASAAHSASIVLSLSEDLVGSVTGLWGLMLAKPPDDFPGRAGRR